MTAKPEPKLKSFALKFALGGVLLIALAAIYFYGTPKQYQATAKVRVWQQGYLRTNEHAATFGPDQLPAECQLIRSTNVLDQVVTNLGLNELWGKKFNLGKPIKTEQARDRLRLISNIQPVGNSSIIDIRVSGEEPNEPALIANEIARAYLAFRQSRRSQASSDRANALRQQWEEQNTKVQESQAKLDKLYFDITTSRATNQVKVYDPDAYAAIQSNRINLESQYVKDKITLEQFQTMDKRRLREVLSSQDTNSDSLLNNLILQQMKARRELAAAGTDHGADSPEVKSAGLAVDELDKRINQQVDAIMTSRETEIVSLKASLDNLNKLSRQAGTNLDSSTLKKNAEEDAAYEKARKELSSLKAQRDQLQLQLEPDESMLNAVLPVSISAQIMDSAAPPLKPAVPDPKIALAAVGAGGIAIISALMMTLIGTRVKKTAPQT